MRFQNIRRSITAFSKLMFECTCYELRMRAHSHNQPPESGIGVVGNKKVTSKRDYMYQQLDGEASISCH